MFTEDWKDKRDGTKQRDIRYIKQRSNKRLEVAVTERKVGNNSEDKLVLKRELLQALWSKICYKYTCKTEILGQSFQQWY